MHHVEHHRQMHLWLTQAEDATLRALAARTGETMSQIIRRLIRAEGDRHTVVASEEEVQHA